MSLALTATHVFDKSDLPPTAADPNHVQNQDHDNTIADTLSNTTVNAVSKNRDTNQTGNDDFMLLDFEDVSAGTTLNELRLSKDESSISLSGINDETLSYDPGDPNLKTPYSSYSKDNRFFANKNHSDTTFTLGPEVQQPVHSEATHAERLLNADPSYRIARAKKAREQAGKNTPHSSNEYVYGIHRIIRSHVKGGMGMVHIAYDQFLKREVALKELFPESTTDESIVHRFIVEAEITAQLEHPGIVPVHSLGLDLNGNPYYTMKLIRGRTLQEAIKQYFKEPSEGELKRLIRRFVSVCKTMAFAHQKGVVHRDLKPANIMLSEHGETLVMDWGIAKMYDVSTAMGTGVTLSQITRSNSGIRPTTRSDSQTLDLTLAGTVVGTPAYMSPEQASPDSNMVGPLSDIFSLGAILFYLLTGRNAYTGKSSQEVLTKVLTTNPPKPSDVARNIPPGLEAICLKAMNRNPKDRYQGAEELDADLCNWLDGEPISAMKESFTEKLWRFARKHRQMSIGAFFVMMLFLIALTVLMITFERQRQYVDSRNYESQIITGRIQEIDEKIPDLEQQSLEAKERCEMLRSELESTTLQSQKSGYQNQINIQLGKAADLDAQINSLIQLRKELRSMNRELLEK